MTRSRRPQICGGGGTGGVCLGAAHDAAMILAAIHASTWLSGQATRLADNRTGLGNAPAAMAWYSAALDRVVLATTWCTLSSWSRA